MHLMVPLPVCLFPDKIMKTARTRRVMFYSNRAFYGGGLFVGADMAAAAAIGALNLSNNLAPVGSAAFW